MDKFSPEELVLTRKVAFKDQQRPSSYLVHRGEKGVDERGNNLDYDEVLPTFQGKSVSCHIDERVLAGEKVSLLDVGCGEGRYLLREKKKYGGMLDVEGISAFPYHQPSDKFPDRIARLEELSGELENLGVVIKIRDVQSLGQYYPPESFDIETAVAVAEHLADPWAMVEGMYLTLKERGLGFIHNLDFSLYDQSSNRFLASYLQDRYGMEVRFVSGGRDDPYSHVNLSFRRGPSPLELPIQPKSKGRYGNLIYELAVASLSQF